MRKRTNKEVSIEIRCTASQKKAIQANAQKLGAKSMSEYLLTLGLEGLTKDYDSMRRKADGALLNAATYELLGTLSADLKARPDSELQVVQDAISLIHETRREIAFKRFENAVEQLF